VFPAIEPLFSAIAPKIQTIGCKAANNPGVEYINVITRDNLLFI